MAGITEDHRSRLGATGIFGSIDLHFAKLMSELGGGGPGLFLASALLSAQTRTGHVCLDLRAFADRELGEKEEFRCPGLGVWVDGLGGTPVVGKPGESTPMILDSESRLYLNRYFGYQQVLSEFILEKARATLESPLQNTEGLKERLDTLFGKGGASADDQKSAACLSLLNGFSVISGGPGTGKTTTVARLLVLSIEQHLAAAGGEAGEKAPLDILLCAPTGKAAMRLKESLNSALDRLEIPEAVRSMIPGDVFTIHRMLGTVKDSPYFRYNRDNRLPADLVVVDEASMVDLALMSKLVSALSPRTALVLLGDKDQLSSVEAGSVLGDICGPVSGNVYTKNVAETLESLTGFHFEHAAESPSGTGMENLITVLLRSYRFGENSGIGLLSRAANAGDHEKAFEILQNPGYPDVVHEDRPRERALKDALRPFIFGAYSGIVKNADVREIFDALDRFRILCAVREGNYGVRQINRLAAEILGEEGGADTREEWYPGRPVMITRNDYTLRLFNGDVGVTVRDGRDSRKWKVVFPGDDGIPKSFAPDQLPEHETAFAMTVHKSQGSEFDRVLLVLPDRESPVLTRELIYTGVTRARNHVTIMADRPLLAGAIERKIRRRSGLRDMLWPKARDLR